MQAKNRERVARLDNVDTARVFTVVGAMPVVSGKNFRECRD